MKHTRQLLILRRYYREEDHFACYCGCACDNRGCAARRMLEKGRRGTSGLRRLLAIFNDAMSKEVVDTQFKPKKIIGRQVVAGMNYKFLCEQGGSEWVVRIFYGLDGESEVTDIYEYKE